MVLGMFVARWTLPTLFKGTDYVFRDLMAKPHLILWAVLAGSLWAVANTLTIFAIRDVGLAIAFPLWNTNCLVGLFWGWFLFNELKGAGTRTWAKVLGGAVAIVASTVLLSAVSIHSGTISAHRAIAGVVAALGAGLLWGTMYVPYRKAYLTGMNPLSFVTVFTFGELGTMGVLAIVFHGSGQSSLAFQMHALRPSMLWLFLGGFCWVIGDLFQHGDSDSCLLPAQIETLKNIYAGPHNAEGQRIFPGFLPGGEDGPSGWIPWITGPAPRESMFFFFGVGYFSNFVYENRKWNYRTYNIDRDLKLADQKTALALNATDTDLKPFLARGGKLILYHGWDDPAIPALSTIDYYNGVVNAIGKNGVDASVRLYMVPGMQHCGGGPGATAFGQDPAAARGDAQLDIFTALEQWVENGSAPGSLIAKKFGDNDPAKGVTMSRPLCPYPLVAKYNGHGNTSDAKNFVCAAETK